MPVAILRDYLARRIRPIYYHEQPLSVRTLVRAYPARANLSRNKYDAIAPETIAALPPRYGRVLTYANL